MDRSLLAALRIQFRVVWALLMREVITRFGRDNLGFVWLFFEPMIFTLAVTALWSAVGLSHTSSIPIVAFALTGYSPVLLWRNCASRCSMAISGNAGLLFHRPVRVLDLLLAKILLEVVGASISFFVLGVLWISIGLIEPPSDLLLVVGGWVLLIWFGGALALNIGAATAMSELWERIWHPTSYILFPLSGAVFMVDWLSGDFQKLVLLFPVVHGIEMMRDGFFGGVITAHYDPAYMMLACLVLTLSGLALTRIAGRRVEFR